MLPPLPRCSRWAYSSLKLAPSISAFPDSTIASACTSSFSRFARRSLALRPAHSRSHQIRDRYPGASDISSPPCLPRLLPAGAIAGWALHPLEKRRLVTAHVEIGPCPWADADRASTLNSAVLPSLGYPTPYVRLRAVDISDAVAPGQFARC